MLVGRGNLGRVFSWVFWENFHEMVLCGFPILRFHLMCQNPPLHTTDSGPMIDMLSKAVVVFLDFSIESFTRNYNITLCHSETFKI